MNEHCIVRGADIPEGRQGCPNCEQKSLITQNPCFGCVPPKRTPDCHSTCPERAEYCVFLEKKKQARKADEVTRHYLAARSKRVRKWDY